MFTVDSQSIDSGENVDHFNDLIKIKILVGLLLGDFKNFLIPLQNVGVS